MAKYILGDIFEGDFPVTQIYGNNPQYYKQFNLAGHEGIDFGTPNGTPILAPFDTEILRDTFGDKDYGNFTVAWDRKQLIAVWFCHLKDVTTKVNDKLYKGSVLGHTDNTGNTTGPHLHFNFVETDAQGNRLNKDNGYQGFLNALDPNLVEWRLGGKQGSVPTQGGGTVGDNIKRKSGFFDIIWLHRFGKDTNTDNATEQQINDFNTWLDSNVKRAGLWDQLCLALKIPGDSNNVTVQQILDKMEPVSRRVELEKIRDLAIKALS